MIRTAFAEGDLATLRRLLGYDLYEDFSESIRQRAKDGDELSIIIHDIRDIALTDGEVSQNIASVTVKFTSVQSRTLADKAGVVIDEDSFEETELTDIWVFERDTSADPNGSWLKHGQRMMSDNTPPEGDDLWLKVTRQVRQTSSNRYNVNSYAAFGQAGTK